MADLIIRHGGGAHYVRPDRVYRTSVLAPITGYDPRVDVQAVAMAFTQGPARGMMLQGLGAMPGPIARLLATIKARIAEWRARKFMETSSGPFVPPGHASQVNGLGRPFTTWYR